MRITAPNATTTHDTVLFATDDHLLDTAATTTIDQFVPILQANPTAILTVAGHTDTQASNAYNIELSKNRAQKVEDYLVLQKSIPPHNFASDGMARRTLRFPLGITSMNRPTAASS